MEYRPKSYKTIHYFSANLSQLSNKVYPMINFNKIAVSEKALFPVEWLSITPDSSQDGKILVEWGLS